MALLRTRLLPITSLVLLSACGQVDGVNTPRDPIVGVWSLELKPLLLEAGYPSEDVDALLEDGFWTWYFDADGELALHRSLSGQEELRRGQWALASEAEDLVRIDLDQGESGLELDYELLDDSRMRARFTNYQQLPNELHFQREDRAYE